MSIMVLSTEYPTKYGHNGYIGKAFSDEDCYFTEEIPTLTMDFSESHDNTIPGLTITWSSTYDEWATEYRVKAYRYERLVFMQTETGNDNVTSIMYGDISEFTKITLEILKWSKPYRRPRVEKLFFGIDRTYGKSELMSYEVTMECDPLTASLPRSEMTFSISNINNEFNPDLPDSASKYLTERQSVTVRYGYKIDGNEENSDEDGVEWIPGGIYYLSDWEVPQNGITASFTCRDALEFMNGFYSGPLNGTLMEIAEAALEEADLPLMEDGTNRWHIDSSLRDIKAPEIDVDEDGEPTDNNGGSGPSVNLHEQTIAVVLQYVANAACCVFYQDREGLLHIEPLKPEIQDYEINQFNSYVNADVTLSKELKTVNINNGQFILPVSKRGEVQPISNPLITDERAPIVASWIAEYLQNRRTLSGQFRADPRLDPLDLISNVNKFSKSIAIITEASFTYNGAFRGSYVGRITLAPLSSYYYSGDIFSGEV